MQKESRITPSLLAAISLSLALTILSRSLLLLSLAHSHTVLLILKPVICDISNMHACSKYIHRMFRRCFWEMGYLCDILWISYGNACCLKLQPRLSVLNTHLACKIKLYKNIQRISYENISQVSIASQLTQGISHILHFISRIIFQRQCLKYNTCCNTTDMLCVN